MAPIHLRISGKQTAPFVNVNSEEELRNTWRVCTKVKDALENGSRLENLSWRLWYLHQSIATKAREGCTEAQLKLLDKTRNTSIRKPAVFKRPEKRVPMQMQSFQLAEFYSNTFGEGGVLNGFEDTPQLEYAVDQVLCADSVRHFLMTPCDFSSASSSLLYESSTFHSSVVLESLPSPASSMNCDHCGTLCANWISVGNQTLCETCNQ